MKPILSSVQNVCKLVHIKLNNATFAYLNTTNALINCDESTGESMVISIILKKVSDHM